MKIFKILPLELSVQVVSPVDEILNLSFAFLIVEIPCDQVSTNEILLFLREIFLQLVHYFEVLWRYFSNQKVLLTVGGIIGFFKLKFDVILVLKKNSMNFIKLFLIWMVEQNLLEKRWIIVFPKNCILFFDRASQLILDTFLSESIFLNELNQEIITLSQLTKSDFLS